MWVRTIAQMLPGIRKSRFRSGVCVLACLKVFCAICSLFTSSGHYCCEPRAFDQCFNARALMVQSSPAIGWQKRCFEFHFCPSSPAFPISIHKSYNSILHLAVQCSQTLQRDVSPTCSKLVAQGNCVAMSRLECIGPSGF